jgi:RNA polymerase sigma factor (sigma-70 family)
MSQIWQAMKGGDPEAVCWMMEKYYQVLYRYGLKLSAGDETLTKDCIQEVFIKLWNNRSGLGDVTLIKPYLLTTFRRRLLDGLAAGHPALMPLHLPGEEDAAFPQAITYSYEDDLIRDQERERTGNRLALALDKLPKRQREAVYLRYYENMEYPPDRPGDGPQGTLRVQPGARRPQQTPRRTPPRRTLPGDADGGCVGVGGTGVLRDWVLVGPGGCADILIPNTLITRYFNPPVPSPKIFPKNPVKSQVPPVLLQKPIQAC